MQQETEVTFTKAEIWEAVMQIGGKNDDMSDEELKQSQDDFNALLDAVAKNRTKPEPAPENAAGATGTQTVPASEADESKE